MSNWDDGYVSDIGYSFGYYPELNPARAKLLLLNKGIKAAEISSACELGFGQGVCINIHAAGGSTEWYGNDFNPSQVVFAEKLASTAKSDVFLSDESFLEFCSRPELPEYDFIGLHGIWSWVSDENRQIIVDFIRRKLSVGGILYISYNTPPGWSTFAPIRDLLVQHSVSSESIGGGSLSKLSDALRFANTVIDSKGAFTETYPQVKSKLEKFMKEDPHYLTHEFFNKDWKPMYFHETNNLLREAKVQFVCSAVHMQNLESVRLDEKQQGLLDSIEDNVLKETVRDILVNQQFRKEYWVKGPIEISEVEKIEEIKDIHLILVSPVKQQNVIVRIGTQEVSLNSKIYNAMLNIMADNKIHSLGDIYEKLSGQNISFNQIVEGAILLIGSDQISEANNINPTLEVVSKSQRLNRKLLQHSEISSAVSFLASPVTGGGIPISSFNQMFLVAHLQGINGSVSLAQRAWSVLKSQNQRITKEEKTLETDEENIAELTIHADMFEREFLVIYKSLLLI